MPEMVAPRRKQHCLVPVKLPLIKMEISSFRIPHGAVCVKWITTESSHCSQEVGHVKAMGHAFLTATVQPRNTPCPNPSPPRSIRRGMPLPQTLKPTKPPK